MNNSSTCLFIIDVQNGFLNEFTKNIPKLIEPIQAKYHYVYIFKFINPKNSLFRSLLDYQAMNECGTDTSLGFNPVQHAKICIKTTYTCIDQQILNELKQLKINQVDICGLETQACVFKTALDLFENQIKPVVLSNLCASTMGKVVHFQALHMLCSMIGKEQVV